MCDYHFTEIDDNPLNFTDQSLKHQIGKHSTQNGIHLKKTVDITLG